MLTARGWLLLFFLLVFTYIGAAIAPAYGEGMAIGGLVLLLWFLFEWATFVYQVHWVLPTLQLARGVHDQRKAVPVLWNDGEFDVRLTLTLGRGSLPYVVLEDWVPFEVRVLNGDDHVTTKLRAGATEELVYRIKCLVPGEIRFEGVRVRLADRQGFFYHRHHLQENVVYPVLPRLTGAEGNRRGQKRRNIFPPPGVHRLKQSGGGTELLDIRDYLPGDPPKMIAWKPSARRDKLFTKEFESEVPIRCTMFVDASESVRVGTRTKNKLNRLVNLAAGVAEATVTDRDHVGLVVFDEQQTQQMRPKRTRRHVIDMLHLLSKAASRSTPLGPFANADTLAKLAFPMASELYPDLMNPKTNTLPLRMFWRTFSDSRALILALIFIIPAFLIFGSVIVGIYGWFTRQFDLVRNLLPILGWFLRHFGIIGTLMLASVSMSLAGYTFILCNSLNTWAFIFHRAFGWFPNGKTAERLRRKQLGLLFATLDGDRAGAEGHYMYDDQVFARRAMRFLADHHARYPVRLYDARGRYLFRSRKKLDVLVQALNYGVARGRDNELFVIMADLIDLVDELDTLVRAVRVAVARHHQVMMILPWQEDIPEPPKDAPDMEALPKHKAERFTEGGYRAIIDEIEADTVKHYHASYFKLRKEFGKLGVIVVRAEHQETVQMVLDRMDRLRGIGRRG